MTGDSSGNNDREQQLNEILRDYLEAVDVGTPIDRQEWLRRHAEFAAELEAFLADYEHVEHMAEPLRPAAAARVPPVGAAGDGPAATEAGGLAGVSLGATIRYFGDYELLEEIARGGMGVVYKARQISLNRIVAVKMILAGCFATKADHDRFHAEAQAAALLDHPNIVPVYEVGEHERQHYFSMGYVDGRSLAARLADGPLPPKEAATLVATVAEAVQYAHRQGVIHRDIKPSNIMIDCQGTPRITDFGLAKRVDSGSDLTATGQVLGTASYMPPEQAAGRINAVGPAADIYALGALLYTSLAGRPPFQAATPLETLQQVIDQEPVALRQLNAAVPRDLETIVLKCLEKAVPRRYATAQALADDLRRYLEGRPIMARPVGRWEHAWRWCRRQPVVASLIAAVALTLVAGILVSSRFAIVAEAKRSEAETQQHRAEAGEKLADDRLVLVEDEKKKVEAQKNKADEEKQVAQAVGSFLQYKLLGQADPATQANALLQAGGSSSATKSNPTILELLDRAALELAPDKIEASFPKQPLVQTQLLRTVGDAYCGVGQYDRAIAFLARAAELAKTSLGADHADTLTILNDLAFANTVAGNLSAAIVLFGQVRDAQIKRLGADHSDTFATLVNLARAYYAAGKPQQAIELIQQMRGPLVKKLGADHRYNLVALNTLAVAYYTEGKLPQAIEIYKQLTDADVRILGANHPDTLATSNNLAIAYLAEGKSALAIELLQRVRDAGRTITGADRPETLATIANLALAYEEERRFPEAIELYKKVLDVEVKNLGPDHPDTVTMLHNLAWTYYCAGKTQEALPLFAQTVSALEKLNYLHPNANALIYHAADAFEGAGQFGKAEVWRRKWLAFVKQHGTYGKPTYGQQLLSLGWNLISQKKYADAEPLLREALQSREKELAQKLAAPWQIASAKSMLGEALLGQGKTAEAVVLLAVGYDGLKKDEKLIPGASRSLVMRDAIQRLIDLATATHKPDEVKKWQAELAKYPAERPAEKK